jgi:hypothetical protein
VNDDDNALLIVCVVVFLAIAGVLLLGHPVP